jgi:soluble lytic murein transglycosylase-like protein
MSAAKRAERIRQARDYVVPPWDGQSGTRLSSWQSEKAMPQRDDHKVSLVVTRWERETRSPWRKTIDRVWSGTPSGTRVLMLAFLAFGLGFAVAAGPQSAAYTFELRERLHNSSKALLARQGELDLTRLELARLNTVIENSERYRIPADLAAKIYDIALAEGIEPKLAFSLVNVESDFSRRAISPKGALGLTQLMPSTAKFFEPRIQRSDLFEPETNLRIGFRFLKELIAKYNGDVDLALHAYNRGPTVVDKVVASGGNPANGYADAVMKGTQ